MRVIAPGLHDLLAKWRAAAVEEARCELDNIWFEECVSATRQQVFETTLASVASWDEFYNRHADYYSDYVKVGSGLLLHTFMPAFVTRDMTGIDKKQVILSSALAV